MLNLSYVVWISRHSDDPLQLTNKDNSLIKILSSTLSFTLVYFFPFYLEFIYPLLSWLNKFLAHLTQRVMWAILITWRPSSSSVVRRPSSVVRRKLFQKSSPLKVLDQWKPNLVWIITRVSSFKIVSGDAVHQPTWPLLLKIEHMVKLQVFGNISKTVSNIKNLTWGKNDQHIKIYLPCNFEVNLITHLGVIALFSSNL